MQPLAAKSATVPPDRVSDHDLNMFEVAPVSLWLEDHSELKALLDQWRGQGVVDLREFLAADTARVQACASCIKLVRVNRKTLSLFEFENFEHLAANLGAVFRDDMFINLISELEQLWNGKTEFFSNGVNYSATGRRIDIQLKGVILPGHEANWSRVLIALEDVTEREGARRLQALSEDYARGLFQHSPVSLWVEDFSGVKRLLDEVRERGVENFRVFTDVHPEFVDRCMSEIRVIDVNTHTLTLFRRAR